MGISINRYLPASGTAGFDRIEVRGESRVPRPPPKTIATTFFMMVVYWCVFKWNSKFDFIENETLAGVAGAKSLQLLMRITLETQSNAVAFGG